MAQARRQAHGRRRSGGRATRRKGSGPWSRRELVVSAEMVPPAACCNDPEPVCEAMADVIADVLNSSGMSSYRIAKLTNLSREEIRKLRRRKCGIGMKSAVIIGRAFFFTYTELAALAEERGRKASSRMG